MHSISRYFIIRCLGFIIVATTVFESSLAIAQAEQVCQNAKGELVVRKKYKKAEIKFSAASLSIAVASTSGPLGPQGIAGIQGPVGPQGAIGNPGAAGTQGVTGVKGPQGKIDFSGCRKIEDEDSNLFNPANGSLTVQLLCDPSTEFLFHDSYFATPFPASLGTTLFLQGREVDNFSVAGDRRTTASYIRYERINVVASGVYTVKASGLCCPR